VIDRTSEGKRLSTAAARRRSGGGPAMAMIGLKARSRLAMNAATSSGFWLGTSEIYRGGVLPRYTPSGTLVAWRTTSMSNA